MVKRFSNKSIVFLVIPVAFMMGACSTVGQAAEAPKSNRQAAQLRAADTEEPNQPNVHGLTGLEEQWLLASLPADKQMLLYSPSTQTLLETLRTLDEANESRHLVPQSILRLRKLLQLLTTDQLDRLATLISTAFSPAQLEAVRTRHPLAIKRMVAQAPNDAANDTDPDPAVVLTVYDPFSGRDDLLNALGYALWKIGTNDLVSHETAAKLSNVDPNGVVYIISHGYPGRLTNASDSVEVSLASLVDDLATHLPQDFHGKIVVLGCNGAMAGPSRPAVVDELARGLGERGRWGIKITGSTGSSLIFPLVSDKRLVYTSPEAESIGRAVLRYVVAFYIGSLHPSERLINHEQTLKLNPQDFGIFSNLAQSNQQDDKTPYAVFNYCSARRELNKRVLEHMLIASTTYPHSPWFYSPRDPHRKRTRIVAASAEPR